MSGAVYVRKSPVATVGQLARVCGEGHPSIVTGIRPGEKHDEALVVEDEAAETWDGHFVIHRGRHPAGVRYSSETARVVSDAELAELLKAAPDAL
jgi:FlaA1/EpsC-like NDP-sugar epimerase